MQNTTNIPTIFTFAETREIRTLIENGEPSLCANDV